MAKQSFQRALKVTLAWEGGYSNHKDDPGGATQKGVTQKVYDAWRKGKGQKTRSVKQLEQAELEAIYRLQYWDAISGDKLPLGLDLAVFDYAVNSGPSRAARSLQQVLGERTDAHIGVSTIGKAEAMAAADEEKLIADYCAARLAFCQKLSTWSTFGKGWARRINGVRDSAIALARGDNKAVQPVKTTDPAPSKANTEDVSIKNTPDGAASGTAGLGGIGAGLSAGVIKVGELAGFTKEQIEPFAQYSGWIMGAFIALGLLGVVGTVALKLKRQAEGTEVA